jgi:hypothetical protein
MANTNYEPGIGNAPFGNLNTNPQASFYGAESEFGVNEQNLIQKAIRRAIFDAAPAQYNSLKLLYAKAMKSYGNDEFEYLEKTFGRTPLEAATIAGAQAAVAGAHQTQTFDLTAGALQYATEDLVIIYPDGSQGVIVDITGSTVTVNSLTNQGLPAVAIGDSFSIRSTIVADGMDYFSNYSRLETITRYNYVQFFLRAQRWSRIEMQKYLNSGTTNYLEHDKEEKIKQLRIDMFNSYWNGQRGEFQISNGYVAKSMGGIYPTMIAAGSATANPTLAGLQAAFESLAFQTNYKAEGGTRFIYGTDEVLHEFSKIYKLPALEYAPNDEIAKLRLKKIELGTMNFVMVPCELWREESCFPRDWQRRIIVLDQESVTPVKMEGIPAMNMGQTDNKDRGSREAFTDFWVESQLSLEFNNPVGSFIIDLQ